MRKIISCFVSISCFFSFCFTAYATEREYGQTTSIPDIIAEAEQISEIAEKHNDYTLLSSVAERFYENVMPTLTEGEIVNIIEDSSQNNLYKSMVIDLYSLANDEATLSATVDGVRLQGPDDSTNTWDISTAFGADYHPGSFRPSLQAQCFDREVSH